MSNKRKLEWETLNSELYLIRARVPGGWLITSHTEVGMGLTFMPDPDHRWTGGSY